ncbi:unannotated protein [freshwater metagenome]|uniref:Unannotated protein n=1 Tax=freshwater metagenome TaxID=449393 RepID=A0A6J7KRG6_9ZZZZ
MDRVLLEVLQRVVHPAHVPLEAEAEAADIRGPRDAGPRGRLLGGGDRPGLPRVDDLVHLLQERDGLEVLAAPVDVGHPLALLAGVVEVEHGRHGVDPQAVDVELLHPVEGGRQEEVADLVATEVEDQRAPVGVRPAAGVRVLVERGAVELGQRPGVAREVRGDPVQEDADAALVHAIDERPEVVRRAVARRRGEVRGHLVAPGARERVAHHGQQLDVREAHLGRVVRELVREVRVAQELVALAAAPRGQVHLVDRHGAGEVVRRVAPGGPLVVAPLVGRLVDDGVRLRRDLRPERERVRVELERPVLGADLVLVGLAVADAGDEELPDAGRAERAHRVQAAVPAVELAYDGDRARVRRPHREGGAALAVELGDVRAELLPQRLVPALAHEVQVELADGRGVAVRVPDLEAAVLAVVHAEVVPQGQARTGDRGLEQAGVVEALGLHRRAALGVHGDGEGVGSPGTDDEAVAVRGRVRAQQRVRVRQVAGDQGVHVALQRRRVRDDRRLGRRHRGELRLGRRVLRGRDRAGRGGRGGGPVAGGGGRPRLLALRRRRLRGGRLAGRSVLRAHAIGSSSRRAMAAAGIGTQSGRWSSS